MLVCGGFYRSQVIVGKTIRVYLKASEELVSHQDAGTIVDSCIRVVVFSTELGTAFFTASQQRCA